MNCDINPPKRLRRSFRYTPEGFRFLLDGKPHPLQIPSVIEEIASYLKISDLKACREVSKSWNNEVLRNIRRLGKIVIQDEEGLIQFVKLHQNASNAYVNYELKGDIDLGSQCAIKFFKVFGKSIKSVFFNRVRWRGNDLKDILFNQLPELNILAVETRAYSDRRLFSQELPENYKLPNIKVLKINVFSFITELTTPLLRDLFRACCNLEVISSLKTEKRNPLPMQFIQYVCQELNCGVADDVVNMPIAADIAIAGALIECKDLALKKLHTLDCNLRFRTPGILQLTQRGFTLKQLELTILSDVNLPDLYNLLSSIENTLTTFKLKFHIKCTVADTFTIPHMKNLTSLTLNGSRHSLKFLEKVPNLESLTLIRLDFSQTLSKELPIDLNFESKLEYLEVYENFSNKCKRETVIFLKNLFPRIGRLKLENLTDDAMCAIFSGYPDLIELDAMNGMYSDSSITGIPISALESFEDPFDIPNYEDLRKGAFLGHLKNLKSLSLSSPKLTDLSVLYGVLQCQYLNKLHLLSNGVTDISMERVIEELDLFHLKTQYCYKISKGLAIHAKEKMRGRYVSINEYEGPLKQSEIPKFMRRNGRAFVQMKKVDFQPLQIDPV